MEAAGAVCFFGGLGFLVALVVGSVILRAAVALANRIIGPPKPKVETVDRFEDWDWDGELEDAKPRKKGKEKAVPEPGIGKGMMIASTVYVLTAFIGVVLAVFFEAVADDVFDGDEGAQIVLVVLFALPLGFVGMALLLTAMLPTTFSRAALVAFIYHFFALLVLGIIGGTLVAFFAALG
jgi:hypothetical protein